MFTNARVRRLFLDWEAVARRMIAIFRVEHPEIGAHPNSGTVTAFQTVRQPIPDSRSAVSTK